MTHTTGSANSMIKVAALVVAGIYAYRRFTEGTAQELKVSTKITPLGQFVVAWSVVFFGLTLLAGPTPTLAGNMAILVMLGSILANGQQVSKDLQAGLQNPVKEREALNKAAHKHGSTSKVVKPPFETSKA
jgi:hypothetical protein